ncbi:hypothetical protein E2P42_00560 [Candidatus Bathyarchaeota archaeon]|nr:hypothetical protein E2P42_00560 [Candidatus Bathyarchaeota archaeon]
MIRVNVAIGNISAERFWDIKKPIPPIQIATNINMVSMERKPDGSVEVPFVLTIIYNPSIAQISLKGTAYLLGEKAEIDKIVKDYEDKKPPPQIVVQSISNVVFIESVLISRTLNIPPPIPLPHIGDGRNPKSAKPAARDYSA